MIGSSRFQFCERAEEEDELEIGWSFLARAYWGKGHNAEFKRLMLEHAFDHVDRVVFRVGTDNVISRKAMAKIGGRLTGVTFVEDRAGRPVEHVVYEITRESFAAGPLAGCPPSAPQVTWPTLRPSRYTSHTGQSSSCSARFTASPSPEARMSLVFKVAPSGLATLLIR